jgi:rhodanese-related sulfurtransferase/uncharacterized membrane protein YphA (DoxX/SURF4 family)
MEIKGRNTFIKFAIPVIRIIIGMAFLLSGIFKLIDLKGFQGVISALGLLGGPLPFLASAAIPVIELVLGIMLILGVYIRIAAIHLNVLVIIFSWVTFYVLRSRPDMLCGCFGRFLDMTFSIYHFVVLFVIFVLNLLIIIEPNDTWTLQKIFTEKITAARKMLIVEILTYILIAIGIILIGIAVYVNFWGQANETGLVEMEDIALEIDGESAEDASSDGEGDTSGQEGSGSGLPSRIIDISVEQAYEAYLNDPDLVIVDVRSESEYESGHIKGALLIPVSQLEEKLDEIPQNKPILVYCNGSSCNRSGNAAAILAANGFKEIYDLAGGGIDEWIDKGYPSQ